MQPSPNPSNLPMPFKVVFLLATGAGLMVIGRELAKTSPTTLRVFTLGIVVVACVMACVMLVQRLTKKRRAARFAKAMTPGKVAGGGTAQVRAQREDLRRRFVEGVDKLRDHGIDSYELPWYVVVGESGGGKTELLRRCGAAGATSHGMTDPLQGVGGTLNMNWWFYNRAVILDTAGRLWEDRDNAVSLSEWEEFLRLLVKYRRATPVNGLILVIPATSLLRDRADAIEAKTATIVEQLHRVRNALEVRFPVYVVVSKCDLIPGFRDFFDHINQPDMQHQILGWTNRHDIDQPLQLDAPVEDTPGAVGPRETQLTRELNQLADQLALRRLALLRDPTPAGPSGRRIDDVDGIFAFPEQFRRRIIPAVSQYVSKVFAAGRYDRKPLFLRGVYFTSSMREGSPLDEDLARMLGKDLDDFAAEEETPREERAYFLTDLFDQKIFREPGLVSRSITPRRQFRRYRAALVGCALLGLVALFTLTLLGSRRFAAGLGEDLGLWRVAAASCSAQAEGAADGRSDIPLVKPVAAASADYVYAADVEVGPAKTRMTMSAYHRKLRDTLDHEIQVPFAIRPFVKPSALAAERRESQAILFHEKVLVPLVTAARARLLRLAKEASADGVPPATLQPVLQALLRLELRQPAVPAPGAAAGEAPLTETDFEALMAFVLVEGTDNWLRYAEKDATREQLVALFGRQMSESVFWPGLRLGLKTEDERLIGNDPVAAGVDLLLRGYCTPQALRDSEPSLGTYRELGGILAAWDDAEAGLLAAAAALGGEGTDWLDGVALETVPEILNRWRNAHDVYLASSATAQRLLGALGSEPPSDPAQRYAEAVKAAIAKARASVLGLVLRDLSVTAGAASPPGQNEFVAWLEKRLEERFGETAAALDDKALTADLQALGTHHLGTVSVAAPSGDSERLRAVAQALGERPMLFRLRQALYAESMEALGVGRDGVAPAEVPPGDRLAAIAWLGAAAPESYRVKEAARAARAIVDLATAQRNTTAALQALKGLAQSAEDIMSLVGKQTERGLQKPTIQFTLMQGGAFAVAFTPASAKAVFAEQQTRREQLGRVAPLLQRRAVLGALQQAEESCALYVGPFCEYWLRDVPKGWELVPFADWRTAQRAVASAKAWEICSGFEDLCGRIQGLKDCGLAERSPDERLRQRWQGLSAEVEAALRHVSSRPFTDQCDAVLRRWGQLPEDPEKARQSLLVLRTADFERDYFVFSPGAAESFLHRYWGGLMNSLLSALVQDSRKAIEPLVADVRTYQRWPLNHPEVGAPLSADDVSASRGLLQKLAMQPGDYAEGSIGTGTGVKDPGLDRLLKELSRVPLPEGDAAWLDRALVVARLIPPNPRLQRSCKAQFLAPRAGDAYPFSRFWTWVVVRQSGKEVAQLNTADTAVVSDLAWHPGEALQLAFYLHPDDTEPDTVLLVEGPWAPLKLLFECRPARTGNAREVRYGPGKPALESSPEGTKATPKWVVPILIADPEGNRREIGLQLTFDQAIPIDWPAR